MQFNCPVLARLANSYRKADDYQLLARGLSINWPMLINISAECDFLLSCCLTRKSESCCMPIHYTKPATAQAEAMCALASLQGAFADVSTLFIHLPDGRTV